MSVMQHIDNDSIHFTTMDTLLRRYLQQARDLYKSWGAIAWIDHLEKKQSMTLLDVSVTHLEVYGQTEVEH